MDYSEIVKVVEEEDVTRVNKYLKTGRWVMLGVAAGMRDDKTAYFLYSLGWYGPYDPEFPEDDTSEFPA
ncbi:MAG TPA: hypothetical protein H9689_06090 [Firmicutes bacterium]|nr:hypothetical protein [Bacillota bacterium]